MKVKVYRYTAIARTGQKKRGITVATSLKDLEKKLKEKGFFLLKAKEVPLFLIKFFPISLKDISLFFASLSKLLESGISITDALKLLIDEQTNPRMFFVISKIYEGVEEGKSFPIAVKEANFVSKDVVEMLKVANTTGKLPEILKNLSDFYTERHNLKNALVGSLAYPILLMFFVVGVILYSPHIFEKLRGVYANFGGHLPFFTVAVVNVLTFLSKVVLFLVLFSLIAFPVLRVLYTRNEFFKKVVDGFFLKVPLFSRLYLIASSYNALLSLLILYSAGIPADEGAVMIRDMQKNYYLRKAWDETLKDIKKGYALSYAISQNFFISNFVKTILRVGEASGRLEEALKEAVKYEKERLSRYISFLTSAFPVVFIVAAGGIVGLVLVALYLPLFNITDLMKNIYGG